MVGVTGFEPATSWSQTTRAPICATPRFVELDNNIEYTGYYVNRQYLFAKKCAKNRHKEFVYNF